MAIADKKKCQTMINLCAEEVQKLQTIAARLNTLRTAFITHSPETTGTALEGKTTAVSSWIDAVISTSTNAVANGLIAAAVTTHRGKVLGDI